MSAVEQAREGLRAAYHAWWSDQTPISVVLAAEEKLIAAVRAERDAAWREESLRVAKDEILTVTSAYNVVGVSIFNKAINAALAALAARMEAK